MFGKINSENGGRKRGFWGIPGGLRGGFLDAEAGPCDDLSAAEMLDLNGRPYESDQVDGVGVLLAPGYLLWPRVEHTRVLVVRIAGASDR